MRLKIHRKTFTNQRIIQVSFIESNNCRVESNLLDASEIRPKCGNHFIHKFEPNIKFGMTLCNGIFAVFNSFNTFCYNVQC